jgi:hypothetical protein
MNIKILKGFFVQIGIGDGCYNRAPAIPPGMRVRTGRFIKHTGSAAGYPATTNPIASKKRFG